MVPELSTLEERFWRGDAAFYEQNLTADSLMVFPAPVGVMDKAAVVTAVATAPRWTRVELLDVRVIAAAQGVFILTYKAHARRDRGDEYRTLASSVYVRSGERWALCFHQQTPLL